MSDEIKHQAALSKHLEQGKWKITTETFAGLERRSTSDNTIVGRAYLLTQTQQIKERVAELEKYEQVLCHQADEII